MKIRAASNAVPATRLLVACIAIAAGLCAASPARVAAQPPPGRDPLVLHMDPAASPAVDFFEYANGKWLKENPIPPAERGWGIANLVREGVYTQLEEICEAASRSGAAIGTSDQKVGDLWATGMDSTGIDRQGAKPLQSYLAEIDAINSRPALLDEIARLHVLGLRCVYRFSPAQDERNSEKYMVHLGQGGLGLGDRDYYFNQDSSATRIRSGYAGHIVAMMRLLGQDEATARQSSRAVVGLETSLAAKSRTLEQRRDLWANYHKLSLADLASRNPHSDWKRQFAKMGLGPVDSVIVGQPEFLARADSLFAAAPMEDWKAYLRWRLLSGMADALSHDFVQEDFRFFGTVLTGAKVQRPRWKRVMDAEESGIGELLGCVWVQKYCSPATKARYKKLTEDIIAAYRERIQALPWMSVATRQRALSKLDHVTRKVAYPEHWRDFSALHLDRSSFASNQLRISEWGFRFEAAKLGKPIDRTLWEMTPQTYNAYYDGSNVEIVLPAAAFLIPGLPDSLVDDALLYSYAGGSTIGHEITHGFDDEGRQSDERGNLNPWWTADDSVQFMQRANKLVAQFDAFVVGDKHVRGRATLGENIADLGGVRLGYEAFKKTDQWKQGRKVNGFTPDQRYFLGYTLSWLGRRRPESVNRQIMTDVHAPEFLRVNGPLANIPEFYSAFGVKPGDPMYRADSVRVEIW